jgi:phage terminase large subunit-like protein
MTRGEKVIQFIHAYCLVPEGKLVGQPIKLEPFQQRFILEVYDNPHGTRRGILSIARKNGKTAIIAALLLAHLVGPEAQQNSQIVSGARSRDQAALVFALASKMVNLNPRLRDIVKIVPSSKRLIGLPMNVEFRALAADGATAHGLSPVLAILDEVGQVRGAQDDFVDAITTSQGAHANPMLLIISTQAPTDADLLSIWIDDALEKRPKNTVCHLYAADADAALDDEIQWRKANPALDTFRSLADLREQAEQASRMPTAENTFRNLCLNQRVSVFSPFVSPNVWRASAGQVSYDDFYGLDVCLGLDLSARNDLTAIAIVAKTDERSICRVEFFAPKEGVKDRAKRDRAPYDVWAESGHITLTPGASVDYSVIAERLIQICQDLQVSAIAFDRWRIDVLKAELAREGIELPLVPFGQGFRDMSPAVDTLESELLQGRLMHDNNPVMNMCATNAVVIKDPAGNRKLDKSKSTARIDGMVALSMAVGRAAVSEELSDSIYNHTSL